MSGLIHFQGDLWKSDRVNPAIAKAAEETRKYALLRLKTRTPVRSGRLRDSWSVTRSGKGLSITNSAKYAVYVELGTRHMAPRRMLSGAIPDIEATFKKTLARELGKRLGAKVIGALAGRGAAEGFNQSRAERMTTSMGSASYQRLTGNK